jgi:hypothetical protein
VESWLREDGKGEGILGIADIQSLADLGNSFAMVREMRAVTFALDDIKTLVAAAALPLPPLVLTIMPLDELLSHLVKLIF